MWVIFTSDEILSTNRIQQFLLAGPWTEEQRATIESSLDVTQLIANADKPCLNLVYPYQPAKARWQAHAIESFGDLILFGTLPVVKDSNGPERNVRHQTHRLAL